MRCWSRLWPPRSVLLALALVAPAVPAQQVGNDTIVEAREALRHKDKARLKALRDAAVAARHPLAMWPDYWELGQRLADAKQAEVDAFYERWRDSYVEDRLRNDWLLELGRRRDWTAFAHDHARYRMQDDRDVACYALFVQHQAGQDVKADALAAWYAQRDVDDACQLLAAALAEARLLAPAEIWHELRLSVEAGRPRAVLAAAALLDPALAAQVAALLEQPARWLRQHRSGKASPSRGELAVLALARLASAQPDAAATELRLHWGRKLGPTLAAWAWAATGRRAAFELADSAFNHFQQAWRLQGRVSQVPRWSDETLAWSVRAALRGAPMQRERWAQVEQSVAAMSAQAQADPTWIYWRARALQALAAPGAAGDAARERSRALLEGIAGALGFYPQLAAQELGRAFALPASPAAPTEAETALASATPGLQRGLQLAQLGLRDEGRREWNFTLRGLDDRALLAAAALACRSADWQLCINTSERTRTVVDVGQRYPMPWRGEITARAQERGLDPALVFGLIRQETRFMPTLRSSAGASGLMQLMPATARWTARRVGLELRAGQITDIDTNLRLGTAYLKLVLDDFAGSQPLAAAAYNAGPNRPRRWREGPALEPAAWAENIPFNETRDYVKKVLGNALVYSQLLELPAPPTLKSRLGNSIGPRDPAAAAHDGSLP